VGDGTSLGRLQVLDLKPEKVHIVSPFRRRRLRIQGLFLAALPGRGHGVEEARRPVKLVLTRAQLFTSVGHRGPTRQELVLSARSDGDPDRRRARDVHAEHRLKGTHVESCGLATSMLYKCPNLRVSHRVARLNTGTPCPMRAPGEAPGTFAIESAMDELAAKLGMDPIALRIHNHADEDPQKKKPWSSKHLLECYSRGAELFGWDRRQREPGSMREKGELVGLGMATRRTPPIAATGPPR